MGLSSSFRPSAILLLNIKLLEQLVDFSSNATITATSSTPPFFTYKPKSVGLITGGLKGRAIKRTHFLPK